MRISHEAIYQALYIQGRGALRRELTACLRTGRALRVPRARTRGRGKSFVTPELLISQRLATVLDRALPGHWEGDLILGLASFAIGTLVERTTRFTLLLHLPPHPEHGLRPRAKNGPALADHGAEAVRDAITRTIISLLEQLRQSLTWDQGAEMSQRARLRIDTGLKVYFCDPQSPWQRGRRGTRRSATLHTEPVLRRPIEPAQYLSIRYSDRLAEAGAQPSVGSAGDPYDNALAETIIGLYKTEVVHRRGPWRSLHAVEYATLEWVDWFNNRRLLEPIGDVPPASSRRRILIYGSVADGNLTQTRSSPEKPGRFTRIRRADPARRARRLQAWALDRQRGRDAQA